MNRRPDITLQSLADLDFLFQAHSAAGDRFLREAFQEVQGDLTWEQADRIVCRAELRGLIVKR